MKNIITPFHRLSVLLGLVLIISAAPFMSAEATKPTPPNQSLLGQIGNGVTSTHDSDPYNVTNKVLTTEDNFKYIIKEATKNSKYIEAVEKAGKYAKVIDVAFKVVKFGQLSIECKQALDAGDRAAFGKAFNKMMKEAIVTAAGTAAATAAGTQGGVAGFALGGPLGAAVGGIVGAIAGGYASDAIVKRLYDGLLSDFVEGDVSDMLFDSLTGKGGQSGAGGGGPPLLPQPGGGGQNGGDTGVLPTFR